MLEASDEVGQGELPASKLTVNRASRSAKAINNEALEDQKMAWLQAEPSEKPNGVPLRCLLCKAKLLVSASTLFCLKLALNSLFCQRKVLV
jgi:hypothetical protein